MVAYRNEQGSIIDIQVTYEDDRNNLEQWLLKPTWLHFANK